MKKRNQPLEIKGAEFKKLGYQLVDLIAEFMDGLSEKEVAKNLLPKDIRAVLGQDSIPEKGTEPDKIIKQASELLFNNSTLSNHPKFLGYIIGSGAPLGALADMLAATVNQNLGGWMISPMATEMEVQTIQWIAEMIGYSTGCGGILVSGGTMANFVGFLSARKAKSDWEIRSKGMNTEVARKMTLYVSAETHTWVQKAADMFGLGTDAIRWIPTNDDLAMDMGLLETSIQKDIQNGAHPFMVVGTAGSVSTGAVDNLPEVRKICDKYDLWFHVDGAYGAFAAILPEVDENIKGLRLADSVALDPHKWLYCPQEVGCALVKNPQHMLDAFSYRPPYYQLDGDEENPTTNFYEFGMQNSRGFRGLKTWMAIRQAGREGYEEMIRDDIRIAAALAKAVESYDELQLFTNKLSITTFRYVPKGIDRNDPNNQDFLNELNTKLLDILQHEGRSYLSNAVVDGNFLLRSCIVNFRTTLKDILEIPEIVLDIGKGLE